MTSYLLDNVLRLYLPFEAAKRILEGFALLNSNLRQENCTPLLAQLDLLSYCKHLSPSQEQCTKSPTFSQNCSRAAT